MMTKARPFTDIDWEGYAGCEGWDFEPGEGYRQLPVTREIGEYQLTADYNGVMATDTEGDCWEINLPLPNQKTAEALLNGLPEDFAPEDYGFEPL